MRPSLNRVDKIIIEMAATRLVLRAAISHLIARDPERAEWAIAALSASADALADKLPLDGARHRMRGHVIHAVQRRTACVVSELRQMVPGSSHVHK